MKIIHQPLFSKQGLVTHLTNVLIQQKTLLTIKKLTSCIHTIFYDVFHL